MLTKNCIICGKEFTKQTNCSLAEWFGNKRRPLGRRFCSRACGNVYRKGKHNSPETEFGKRKYTPWLKGTKGVMEPNSGSFKRGHKMSPETKEKMKGRTPWNKGLDWKEMQGANHHNWKDGRTELKIAIRTTAKYKRWRTSIFQRDHYTCTKCGYMGNKLQVHHKKAFYLIVAEHDIKTVKEAKECDELWNLGNGETLCVPCHRQTDSYLVNQYT